MLLYFDCQLDPVCLTEQLEGTRMSEHKYINMAYESSAPPPPCLAPPPWGSGGSRGVGAGRPVWGPRPPICKNMHISCVCAPPVLLCIRLAALDVGASPRTPLR